MPADNLLSRLRATPPLGVDADRLAAAAADYDVLDVAYASFDTAIGPLLAALTPRGLVRLAFADDEDAVLERLAARVSPRLLRAPERLASVERQIHEYLAGDRRAFDVPVDWQLAGPFQRAVLTATADLAYGATTTYGALAARVGRPQAARATGRALATNPVCIVVPCHRVVPATGGLGGYAGGVPIKERLLELETAA